MEFREKFPYEIKAVQTDNGGEFLEEFQKYLEEQDIIHNFIYPRSPKINCVVERFNRTIQEEFIQRNDYLGIDTEKFNLDLVNYLSWYNQRRPHHALGLKPPEAFINTLKVEYQDVTYAIQSARDMGIDYEYVDISPLVEAVYQTFPNAKLWELSGILPRLRASLLYQAADNSNAICAGTTNGTEFILAAFSVGGPAGHFQPFIDFYKSEVYKIAEMLGVPDYTRKRRPGISELGIYDEQLYGASCYVLDLILRRMNWQKRSPEKVARELGHDVEWLRRIKELRIEGERGRKYPPGFVVGRGYKIKVKPDVKFDRDRYFDDLF